MFEREKKKMINRNLRKLLFQQLPTLCLALQFDEIIVDLRFARDYENINNRSIVGSQLNPKQASNKKFIL